MTTWTRDLDRPLLDVRFPLSLSDPFTLADALTAGLTAHQVRGLVVDGLLRRVVKGVYVAAQAPDDMALRARALRCVVPSRAVVTDWTAFWFWTGRLPSGAHLETPALSVFHMARHNRLRNDLCASGSRDLRSSDLTSVDGLRLTTPLRTAWDLGRMAHRDQAIGALDALLRQGTFGLGRAGHRCRALQGHAWGGQPPALAPLADARSESPGESLLRLRWLDSDDLPTPTPQVPVCIGGVEIYRIDLGVEELRYGCEYDGREFHDEARAGHDRARRADLRQRFGWTVESVRRENVSGAHRDVEEILHRGVRAARGRLRGMRAV